MHSIFIARGPHIRFNSKSFRDRDSLIPIVENLDLYPLIAEILRIPARPNNGTRVLAKAVLI